VSGRDAADNQSKMATEGGIDMLIDLLASTNEHVQRQAAKALANLGVNGAACLAISLGRRGAVH